MVTRAAVRSVTTFSGNVPPAKSIDLRLESETAYIGGAVTGMVRLHGQAPIQWVRLVLEAIEYSVVAFPQTLDNNMGLEYLKKHSTQTNVLTRQELTVDCSSATPQIFRFAISEELPGTLRYVLDGTDPTLPSQCQIKYTVSASIYKNSSSTTVSHPFVVLPKRESNIPLDPMVSVSIGSPLDLLFQYFFSCGSSCTTSDEGLTPDDKHMLLEPSLDKLNLAAGQSFKVQVQDWFQKLAISRSNVWMIKVTEELKWEAQGRFTSSQQSWDLFANHHEIPTTLRRTYDHNPNSLVKVRHELVAYLTTKGPSKEVIAKTFPIPVEIVSSQRGWDA